MPILLCWLRQTKGWVEFSGMKPSPAVSGACSSVSYWPSISSDPALGWLCLHQQQKQKSKVYFPAVDTLSASGKWQTGHNTSLGAVGLPGVGLPSALCHLVASNVMGMQLQLRHFLPRYQLHTNPPISVSHKDQALKNEAASMKAAGEGSWRAFWKAENRKCLIKLWGEEKYLKKKKK